VVSNEFIIFAIKILMYNSSRTPRQKKKKKDIMLHIPNSWEKIPRTYNEKLPLVCNFYKTRI
jgi:predicted ATP-grasp superfamily ATP-dependent carboligase